MVSRVRSAHPTDRHLPQLPPRRHRQRPQNLVAAHHHHFVHHVDDDADMVGHDPHDIADIRACVAAGEVEKTMLLGKARDLGFGMFEDQAVAFEPPPVSDVSVLEPASRMPRSGPARLTTVE